MRPISRASGQLWIVQVKEADGSYLAGHRDGAVGHHYGTVADTRAAHQVRSCSGEPPRGNQDLSGD